jgi:hypothetical protein
VSTLAADAVSIQTPKRAAVAGESRWPTSQSPAGDSPSSPADQQPPPKSPSSLAPPGALGPHTEASQAGELSELRLQLAAFHKVFPDGAAAERYRRKTIMHMARRLMMQSDAIFEDCFESWVSATAEARTQRRVVRAMVQARAQRAQGAAAVPIQRAVRGWRRRREVSAVRRALHGVAAAAKHDADQAMEDAARRNQKDTLSAVEGHVVVATRTRALGQRHWAVATIAKHMRKRKVRQDMQRMGTALHRRKAELDSAHEQRSAGLCAEAAESEARATALHEQRAEEQRAEAALSRARALGLHEQRAAELQAQEAALRQWSEELAAQERKLGTLQQLRQRVRALEVSLAEAEEISCEAGAELLLVTGAGRAMHAELEAKGEQLDAMRCVRCDVMHG